MYAGGWEVVGRNKKDKSVAKTGKLTKAEKKKFIENAPKVEDFLPLDQVKSLYENLDGNKENKKPAKEKESKTKENEEKKKQQKQQQVEKKKDEQLKEKPPRSIEEALNFINVTEVQNLLATNQANFPDAPLVWLKSLVGFLNAKIPVEKDDPIFSGRPDGYPLSVVPKSLRVIFEKAIDAAGAQHACLFYEFILTAFTMEMTKNVPVVGYKIFVQLLAKYDPTLGMNNIPKLISMRNSYQNRKPIGLSLLWSYNQSGRENLTVGLTVWHEVIAPMLETKNYSSYVIQILGDLISWHSKDERLRPDLYFNIFDDFYSGKLNISSSVINEGAPNLEKLRCILFQNKNINHRKIFETLLTKVTSKASDNQKNEVLNGIVNCLGTDDRCFTLWKSLYMKNLYTSSILLTHIDSNWNKFKPFLNIKLLTDILLAFQLSYEKSKKGKGKDDKYLYACKVTTVVLIKKMSSKKSSKGGFPWKTGCFLLLLFIGAIVAYDTHKHGSFEATNTARFLKDSGICAFVQKTWVSTKLYADKGRGYIESSSPEYYKAVIDFSKPYIKLAEDVYLVLSKIFIELYDNVSNYIVITKPLVQQTIEQYVPGLLDSLQEGILKGIDKLKGYSVLITEQIVENSFKATRWLKTNVFIGKLSPENLQNYASQAINTTQAFASQTYNWVYEKVQTISKVD
ncbi:transmembrane protein 214-B [Phymastichus coffea]|uniref:transmembrane protein 214-B n=1 Tax=Phymastichus coffea TaxID=108790 RepID=UPI00273B871B|nr:transmembrane protein 214-B [Phymastichus coffea]